MFFQDGDLRNFLTKRMLNEVYERIRTKDETSGGARVLPFSRVPAEEVRPFVNAVPVYELKVAAGRFSGPQAVQEVPQHEEVANPSSFEWAALEGRPRPAAGLFVAQVVGESMNRKVPNGSWCLWRLHPDLKGDGTEVVLAQQPESQDSDMGEFTVKLYEVERERDGNGGERVRRITLRPDSNDAAFQPIVLENLAEGELIIVAEMVEVLG